MQSSTAVACRVLVLLVCLIAMPMVAIFGSSLPEVARALFGGHWGDGSGSARDSLADGPRLGTASEMVGELTGPLEATQDADAPGRPAGLGSFAPRGVIQAGLEVPSQSAAAVAGDWPPPLVRWGGMAGAVAQEVADAAGRPPGSRLAEMSPIAPPAAAGDSRVIAIRERLHQLGATHFLLEPWGSRGQLFRFHCNAAIGGSANWNRYFEATDADPLRAMTRVLQEVEAWRARRP